MPPSGLTILRSSKANRASASWFSQVWRLDSANRLLFGGTTEGYHGNRLPYRLADMFNMD